MNKNVSIKWNKEVFTIEVNDDKTIKDIKEDIHKLKNINPNSQKLMLKGKLLNDDQSNSIIQDGVQLTLIGKANDTDVISSTTVEYKPVKFLEDMTEKEIATLKREKGEIVLYGLENLGNTCYFNSIYQCLGRCSDLRNTLITLSKTKNFSRDNVENFALSMGKTYAELDNASETVVPKMLIGILRNLNPMFAEQDQRGFKQQDAVECFEFILNVLKTFLKTPNKDNKFSENLIDELFAVNYDIIMTSVGEDVVEVKNKKETVLKLVCYIDKDITELLQGLKFGIKENVELFSEGLGRNVIYEKTQLISRIPPYLTVQFMRFFWKAANDSIFGQDGQAGKAKMLKSILFSKILDIYDLCSDDTKALLDLGRSIEIKLAEKDKNYSMTNPKNLVTENMIPTGRYQLIAVCTHKGRSSDSGHYIGWTQLVENKWVKYDDDTITYHNDQQIQDLKGGGDHHMTYLCFYKRLEVPFQESD